MVRHALQWIAARELVNRGKIGEVRAIQVFFSYFNDDAKNVRNMLKIGGGGLLDIGCYPITVSRYIFGNDPKRVTGTFGRDPKFKTDRVMGGLADYGNGRHLSFSVLPACALPARADRRHKGTDRDRDSVQCPPDKPTACSSRA